VERRGSSWIGEKRKTEGLGKNKASFGGLGLSVIRQEEQ